MLGAAAFADSIHTFFDRSTVTEMINITPQQNDEDYIIEITGEAGKLEALIQLLKPMGIKKIARTGPLALIREPN